jgi:predicted dehydrogenase
MIKVALIGLGKMGISHLSIINAHPGVDLVAVCDPVGLLVEGISKYTGIKSYTDYKQLFAKEQLDAVFVATPSKFHGEIVKAALDKGMHVFCEKPFCLDLAEGEALAKQAEDAGLVNQIGYHYRFVGAFQEVKRLVEAGAIGEIHHVRAEAYGPVVLRPKGSTWRSKRQEGGGCLYDYASHGIDLLNFIVGPPKSVAGTVLNRLFSADVDDEVYSTLHYDNGMSGQVAANWSDESLRKMSMKITIWGKAGRIQADRQEVQMYLRDPAKAKELNLNLGWNAKYTTELTEEVWFYLRGEEYSAQIDHFVKAIETGSKTVSPFRSGVATDAVAAMMISDAAGISVRPEFAAAAPARSGGLSSILPWGKKA